MTSAGIVAVSLILGSYLLGAVGYWSFDSVEYNFVQLVAGVTSAIVMSYARQWPYVVLNVAWASVALVKILSLTVL